MMLSVRPFSAPRLAPTAESLRPLIARRRIAAKAQSVQLPTEFTKIHPKGQLILARVPETQTKTSGGLHLPSSAQKGPTTGTVVAVGDGRVGGHNHTFTVQPDDIILYSKFGIGITELELGQERLILIREEDILGTLPSGGTAGDDIAHLNPVLDRVLVKVQETADESVGGVLLPESAKGKPLSGEVVAHGPGKLRKDGTIRPARVKDGDCVVYFKYAGDTIEANDGTRYVVLREQDILCTM